MMGAICTTLLLSSVATLSLSAQEPTTAAPTVTFGAFADAYYAYDIGRPPTGDRSYTTQPARHNEFNVNLAFVEVRVVGERIRGRLALQAGTSVQSNYAAEPHNGSISGPEVARHIQEAVIGVRLAPTVWVDGGIYFSHIGQESWISRDNPTYSRSLTAEYTPYYSSGVKLSWQAQPTLAVQFHIVNGWQNISETNESKAVGARLDWQVMPSLLLGYDNFIGDEQPESAPSATRVFHEVFAKATVAPGTDLWITANHGSQEAAIGDNLTWYSFTLVGRTYLTPRVALNARIERYADSDQAIIVTGLDDGLEAWGASLGVDVGLEGRALWRTELRGFRGKSAVFPDHDGPASQDGGFIVSSLAITF